MGMPGVLTVTMLPGYLIGQVTSKSQSFAQLQCGDPKSNYADVCSDQGVSQQIQNLLLQTPTTALLTELCMDTLLQRESQSNEGQKRRIAEDFTQSAAMLHSRCTLTIRTVGDAE